MKLLSDQVDEREIKVILRELEKTRAFFGDVVEFGCYVGTTSVFLAKTLEKWGKIKYTKKDLKNKSKFLSCKIN